MIKFFRHIRLRLITQASSDKVRQAMIKENSTSAAASSKVKTTEEASAGKRFSKYMLYAIGEIVLVVIGILIALQINTWNEERKAELEECKILNSLLADLLLNNQVLESFKLRLDKQVEYTNSMLSLMSINQEEGMINGLDSLISLGTEVEIIQLRMGALEGVIADKIGLISNDSIQILIMAYPTALSQYKAHEQIMRTLTDTKIRPRIKDFLDLRSILFKADNFPSDRKGLMSDRMFANHLVDRVWESVEWRQNLDELQVAGRHLTQAIENHLNHHCQP